MDLARFAIEKRVISVIATLLILLLGFAAYQSLPRFEDPEFVIREAQIITPYPGASAEEVEIEVTDLIENTLQQLDGIDEITSVSSPGLSQVTVAFTRQAAPGYPELNQLFTQMRAKIADVQASLPPNALPTQVYDDFGDVFALYFALVGDGYDLAQLHAYAETLQRELVLVDGVATVILTGVQQEVIYVESDPARLIELGLSPDQLSQVLEGQNLVTPSGSLVAGERRIPIRPQGGVASVEAIENLVLSNPQTGASFRLSDIATISRGFAEPATELLFHDGQPAIGIGISNVLGGNVVEMGAAVRDRIAALEAQRPIGMELIPMSDQSLSVETAVSDFVMNVLLALGIVVGTLLIFMGLRSGLLMGGILIVTVAGTLVGMALYGIDLQRVSLGAMIIALGMLVDNAIVVVEGTLVRVQRGQNAAEASQAVVRQTKWPLLGGTIVGFLAFAPIGFSPDDTGEYTGSLFFTITIALLFSWIVAIWLTPFFCTVALKAKPGAEGEEKPESRFLRAYRGFLAWAIRWRYATIGFVVLLFASIFVGGSYVPPGFFPPSTRTQFVIDYYLPQGTDIATTEADLMEIEAHLRTLDRVTGTNAVVGAGHARFMLTYITPDANSAFGQIIVDVDEFEAIAELRVEVQDWLNETYPQASAQVFQFELGPAGGAKIEARFYGPDPNVLRDLSAQAEAILAANGAVGVRNDWREQIQVLRPVINTENARRLGLTQGEISAAINTYLNGASIGIYREGNDLLDIVLRPYSQSRDGAADLWDIQVFSTLSGGYIPIAQVVDDFELVFESGNLRRIDRALAITAQADNPAHILTGDFFAQVRGPIEAIDLPPGYSMSWEGEYGSSEEANAALASTMPIGFGAMILVVFLLFNAVRQPVIIWLTVPLALIGVIWGLAVTGTPFEFMAILATLSLTGMLIKNAIVLIDETDLQIREGKPRLDAVIDAAVSRVRPVILGVVTTVLGVVPLLWDPFFASLSVVIIFGLTFATVLTLIIVPTLYTVFFRVRPEERLVQKPAPEAQTAEATPA